MPSGLSRSVASRRSAAEELLPRRLVHGLPDVAREPVGHLLHVGAKRASLLGERPGGIENSTAFRRSTPASHSSSVHPRNLRIVGASIPTTDRERGHQRFETVETVHGERGDMAVESMLAKQCARVPELEVRGLGLVESAVAAYNGRPPPLSWCATAIAAVAAAATSADSTSSPHRRRSAESATAVLAVSASSGLEKCHASGIALATMSG